MRRFLRALAAALAAIPRIVVRWCDRCRAFITECLPGATAGSGLTTVAGDEADDALRELHEAREEQGLFQMTPARAALQYAAAVVHGSAPPDISELPPGFQCWLEDLEPCACRKLLRCQMQQIERHISPRCGGDHLFGVPSYGDRPERAAPVGHGSKRQNAAAMAQVQGIFDDLLNDPGKRDA